MSVIKAGTTLTTAYTVEADTTGALEFKTGPSATLAMSISSSGVVTFPATTGFDIASANITNLTSRSLTVSAATYLATASGSVGIGTSSPGYKLDVNGRIIGLGPTSASSGEGGQLRFRDDTGTFRWQVGVPDAAGTAFTFYDNVASATRLTLNASGNLGLGVTPSASWRTDATLAVLEVKSAGSAIWNAGARNFNFSNNSYWVTGGSFQYASTGAAAWYQQTGGEHRFYNAASGTAGNTISFTQAMTLDASGNLGVGQTSPATPLDITKNGTQVGTTTAYIVSHSRDATPNKGIALGYDSASQTGIVLSNSNSASSNLAFWTYDSSGSGWAERARITAAGDIYISKTGASQTTLGWEFWANGIGFQTFTQAATNEIYTFNNTSTSGTAIIDFRTNAVSKGKISWNNTDTTYATTSDRRLKDNITPAADAGAVIDAIEVVKHDWKVGGHTRYGVIAQDLYEVAPEAVAIGDDGEEVGRAWAVDYSKLVPMLVKEIQSLRARSSALEAKVAALESK